MVCFAILFWTCHSCDVAQTSVHQLGFISLFWKWLHFHTTFFFQNTMLSFEWQSVLDTWVVLLNIFDVLAKYLKYYLRAA